MKKITSFIVLIWVFSSSSLFAAISLQEKSKALRHNVLSVNAKMTNNNQQGFAWVVGDRDGYLYLVTANHVISGANPGDELKQITVRFFDDGNTNYQAEVVPGDSMGFDLAVLKMKMPNRRPWLYASADLSALATHKKVTFIGQGADWVVGKGAGKIEAVNLSLTDEREYDVTATDLALDVGTSGGPLIGVDGFVGMLVTNSSDQAGVISLSKIRQVVTSRGLPWGLISSSKSAFTLGGIWAPKTPNIPDDIRLTFSQSDDYAHFHYKLDFPSSPRGNIGIAVVDGDEVRIWQSMSSAQTSYGTFKVYSSNDSLEGIVMDGFITDGGMQSTQLRLTKQKGEADDPRAIAWMQANPSTFENMFKKYLPAINVAKNGGSDDEAFAALGENEQQTVLGGMAQGMMLRAGLMRLAQLGLTQIKLDIKGNCYIASGTLATQLQKNEVDTLLKSLADDASEQLGKNYKTCNQTQIANAGVSETNFTEFDYAAELIQPRRILSGLAPDATLTVDGDCLLLEGKLQSPIHKMMLADMLKDLAEDLSDKSNKALKACDKTTT